MRVWSVRCDARAEKVVSVQFVPTADIGASPPPDRPVTLTIDDATPLIANWEFPCGARRSSARMSPVTTIIAIAGACQGDQAPHDQRCRRAGRRDLRRAASRRRSSQVLAACGYTLGRSPVREPQPKPADDSERAMKLGRLNHVGVATPSIERSVETYRTLLGATAIGEPFDLPAQGVKVCFVDTPNTQIELIEPYDDSVADRRVPRARTRRAGSIMSVSRCPISTRRSPI